jgi:hypothetical protein
VPWAAAATFAAGAMGADASRHAANTQRDSANAATAAEQAAQQQYREDTAGQRAAGNWALSQIMRGMGGNGATAYAPTRDNFDAAAYLRANPDVAAAPQYASNAYQHYLDFGQGEGRAFTYTPEVQAQIDAAKSGAGGGPAAGDFNRDFTMADFHADPGLEFRAEQGQRALQASAAARGGLLSGATLKAIQDFGQKSASQEFGAAYDRFNADRDRRYNRLATVAGIGQTATRDTNASGITTAGRVGENLIGGGNASAAGTIGGANAITGAGNTLASLYYLNRGNPRGPSGTSYIDPGTYAPDNMDRQGTSWWQ